MYIIIPEFYGSHIGLTSLKVAILSSHFDVNSYYSLAIDMYFAVD